ncbi:unnamed protein product [Leuciscus chuanchicus]
MMPSDNAVSPSSPHHPPLAISTFRLFPQSELTTLQPQAKERNLKLPQASEQIPVSTPFRLCFFPLRARKRRDREAMLSRFGLQIALENLKAP